MIDYITRRLLIAIPLLLCVITITFFMTRVAPGNPARVVLGSYASQEAVNDLMEKMGLDKPLHLRYFNYLSKVARGDLGKSLVTGVPITSQLATVIPYSFELTFAGLILGGLIGIPLGIYTALRRNKVGDYIGRAFSLAGLSFPSFYLGILLMFVFALRLDLFPTVGGGNLNNLGDNLRHLFLPALTLGLIMAAYTTRLTRSTFLDLLGDDFVNTARAKGLRERVVLFKHVLKNALIPITSLFGLYSIILMGASVTTEIVFSRPGLGKLMVGAILQRDYFTAQSVMMIYGGLVVMLNLLTDIACGILNPRITYD